MVKFAAVICSVFSLFITSCMPSHERDVEIQNELERIWALSDRNLDSAVMECKSLEGIVYTSSEYTRMKYDLLNIRLRYKCSIPISSADSIKKITSYMEKHGTGKDRMRAYYYMGGILEDLYDSPRAVEYTLKSLEYKDSPQSCDSIIAQKCYSLLSEIYRKQRNTQEAISMALAGLKLAEQTGMAKCWYTMDVATSYNMAEEYEKGMEYYNKAYELLLTEKKQSSNLQLIAEMMHVYAHQEDFKKVNTLTAIIEGIPEHKQLSSYYYAKGVISSAKDLPEDSTIMYFQKAVEVASDIRQKLPSLSYLIDIYNGKEDYRKSAIYAWQYKRGVQELHKMEQQEWTRSAKGMYEYQKEMRREEILGRQILSMKLWGISMTCALVCAVSVIVTLYFRHKKNLLEANMDKEQKLSELQDALIAKNKEIEDREKELQILNQHSQKIEEDLLRQRTQTKVLMRISRLNQAREDIGQVVQDLEKIALHGRSMNDEEWKKLRDSVDAQFPTFATSVAENIPRMKEVLLRTCYLMKIGMSNQQIEILTNSAHQTVWNRVRKINKHLGQIGH